MSALTDMIVELSTKLLDRSLTVGDTRVAVHAATCGTSTIHAGHCTLDCVCWCHGPVDGADRAVRTAT